MVQQRYSTTLLTWCQLENGKFLFNSWSEDFEGEYTPPSGMTKIDVIYQGLVIEPRGKDCHVVSVFKVIKSFHFNGIYVGILFSI